MELTQYKQAAHSIAKIGFYPFSLPAGEHLGFDAKLRRELYSLAPELRIIKSIISGNHILALD